MDLRFRIFRYDPETDQEPYYRTYSLVAEPEDRVLDCLNRIRWEQDATLSYRMSCAHGVCGSDGMRINGKCSLACQRLVKDLAGVEVLLEPLPFFAVIKDLIVDMDPLFKRIQELPPYVMPSDDPPDRERIQTPEDAAKLDEVIRCILCACCTGACPVMGENPEYVGPAALVWAYRFVFDSRDEREQDRLQRVNHPNGVWACVNHFECTRACPKRIPVTKCINTLKRMIATVEK